MALEPKIQTPLTKILNIPHPVMLAGMGVSAGPPLAAAVTNAGGIGVLGGFSATPERLRELIHELKSLLVDKNAPFGVDLLLPKIGGGARKTNYDYTNGQLDDLITVCIEEKAKVFVSAIGIPPKYVIDRLHANNILYMNMIGHPKHVAKCVEAGVDILGAQGSEGGGHTGNIPTGILVTSVAKLVRGVKSKFTGEDVQVVAAGGMVNGEGLAAAIMMGASGVWMGTRFLLAEEATVARAFQEAVQTAGYDDTIRTIIYSGRPLRIKKTPYVLNWEENRQAEIKELTGRGILPVAHDAEQHPEDDEILENIVPYLMGVAAAQIDKVMPARDIVNEVVNEAAVRLMAGTHAVITKPKL
ncbi:2-nitropropane dioxygenase [Aspergillus granulosus]|uniref:2-nitropropane dioxygenase n=1 Tax=Aspergillus granulosus TaxID=176169 RepID=A0ABR4HA39_9EURO